MMELKITAETPLELLASVAAFGLRVYQEDLVAKVANHIFQEEEKWEKKQENPSPVTDLTPEPAAPAPAQQTEVSVQEAAPAFSKAQVSKAGADLLGRLPEKMNALVALLGQYGVQAIADLKEDQLAPFAAALRELGAEI